LIEGERVMIRRKKMLIAAWAGLFLALILTAWAEAQPPSFHDSERSMEDRERIRNNIETLRMWKLLDALDLSSEQSTQFLPVLKEFQDAKQTFSQERERLFGELEAELNSEKPDQQKLQETMAGLEGARDSFQQSMERFFDQSKEILSVEQLAKLYLFEERFEKRLRESIQEMRGRGAGHR
jgi:Spy/CpxP family protein refolding chaperone